MKPWNKPDVKRVVKAASQSCLGPEDIALILWELALYNYKGSIPVRDENGYPDYTPYYFNKLSLYDMERSDEIISRAVENFNRKSLKKAKKIADRTAYPHASDCSVWADEPCDCITGAVQSSRVLRDESTSWKNLRKPSGNPVNKETGLFV